MRFCLALQAIAGAIGAAAARTCISSGDETTIQNALSAGGQGAIVQLCPNAVITIYNTIKFTANNQEISTQGYPTDSSRGTILLSAVGNNITGLIHGAGLSGIRLLNVQVDGNRPANGVVDNGVVYP